MAIPVLLVLAVLWAAVLVPPVLRSRNENRRGDAIGDLTHRLGALTARPASGTRRPAGVVRPAGPARAGSTHPARYAGRPRPGGAARPVRTPTRPVAATAARTVTPAQKRRRDVLTALGAAAAVTLVLAIALRMPVLWVLHLLADTLLGVYVYLLVQLKQRGSLVGPPAGYTPHTARVDLRHPEPAPRPELAPVPHHALRRTASS